MRYWLVKTEPRCYSFADLQRDKVTFWDGVRNYQARNFLRAMKRGDKVLVYHSGSKPPGVAGIAFVQQESYPDPTQFDPGHEHYDPRSKQENPLWDVVDLAANGALPEFVSLTQLKKVPELEKMLILRRGNRLSVTPLEEGEFRVVCALGGSSPSPKAL